MIPKYLKLKGLYSYQTEQEIDFDPLTESSLFGIFGAVGSGKSSILEAITFALYGDTERLNKSGDDRTYNMMNLRSDDLLIDFECIAGKKGDRYRFTVRGKRNTKNFKDVKTYERRAYIQEDGNWVPLPENESAESIIGLSYDNFRRTIIIPQGRFQEFIELRDSDRTRMMKELFQLEKYDLSRSVGSLSKQNDLAMSNVDGQLLSLNEVTAEAVEAEEKKRGEVKLEIIKVNEELVLQTALEAQFQKLKLISEKLLLLQNQLNNLQEKQPSMNLREETLKVFEICSLHFKSVLDQKRNVTTAITRDQFLFQKNATRVNELAGILEKQTETLRQLKPKYDTREELLDTAEELEKVLVVQENSAAIVKAKTRLVNGEEQLIEKGKSIDLLKKTRLEKESENDLLKNKVSDIQELSLVKSWFTAFDSLTESRLGVKKEAEMLQAEIVRSQHELNLKTQEISESLPLTFSEMLTVEVFQQMVQDYLRTNEEEQKAFNKQLLQTNTRLALHEFAGDLEDGVPCPLCGAEHHPAVLHADHAIHNDLLVIEKQLTKLDQQEKLMRRLQTPVEKFFTQIENLEKQKSSIKQRFNDAKLKLEEHEIAFVWDKFSRTDREGFEKHFAEISKMQTDIKANETTLKELSSRIDRAIEEKTEKFEKPLQTLKDDILKLENTVSTLKNQLVKVKYADFETRERSYISEQVQSLKNSYKEITRLFEESEKQLDVFEKEKNTLSGSQQTLEAALAANKLELNALQTKIDQQVAAFAFESEIRVQEILQKPIEIDRERKEIDQFKFALESTTRDLQNLLAENPEQHYDVQKHQEVIDSKKLLTETLQTKQKEEGGLERLLKKLAEDLSKKALLLAEKGRLQVRKEHLDDLTKLFRSSGFVDYASSIYLQNLIQAANHRFHQMTHQQLHLELGEGNSFWVRDLLNGGHLRLLKTLSGGQKFQAALSLALALADHIHIRNESKHNFFFLDEGFGSLDKNALQTVFDTLKSLRKENRIVGIISHVEDLQQEIQTYLKITESEEGSRIEPSWK